MVLNLNEIKNSLFELSFSLDSLEAKIDIAERELLSKLSSQNWIDSMFTEVEDE